MRLAGSTCDEIVELRRKLEASKTSSISKSDPTLAPGVLTSVELVAYEAVRSGNQCLGWARVWASADQCMAHLGAGSISQGVAGGTDDIKEKSDAGFATVK